VVQPCHAFTVCLHFSVEFTDIFIECKCFDFVNLVFQYCFIIIIFENVDKLVKQNFDTL